MSLPELRSFFTAVFVLVSLLLAVVGSMPAGASSELLPDRESTYPEGIKNITHSPWDPSRGEDVQVTVTLAEDADPPDRVSLLWCRVEPDYVCAIPTLMEPSGDHEWTGTIDGSSGGERDVIRKDTYHIGYNVSVIHDYEDKSSERLHAPLGNHWAPDTFPLDTGGNYYFLNITDQNASPAFAIVPLLVALGSLIAIHRMRGGKTPDG